jgi:hypothetical protein
MRNTRACSRGRRRCILAVIYSTLHITIVRIVCLFYYGLFRNAQLVSIPLTRTIILLTRYPAHNSLGAFHGYQQRAIYIDYMIDQIWGAAQYQCVGSEH